MSALELHPAGEAELEKLWPTVMSAGLHDSFDELRRFHAEAPWRVQLTAKGEAALLVRWRQHLDILSIRGLWCSPRRTEEMLRGLREVAVRQGYGGLLSPLVARSGAGPYLKAGMSIQEEIVGYRLDRLWARRRRQDEACEGVSFSVGTVQDLDSVRAVDAAAFSDFWRYDDDMLRRYLSTDRVFTAQGEGGLVGYALCSVNGEEGILGRLAVHPDFQNRGLGRGLLSRCLDGLLNAGVSRVTLCTQKDNKVSRRLYEAAGFRKAGEEMLFLVFKDML